MYYLNCYKVQTTNVRIQIDKINIQEKISITLLQNHILKSQKRRKMFDGKIDDDYKNKKKKKNTRKKESLNKKDAIP